MSTTPRADRLLTCGTIGISDGAIGFFRFRKRCAIGDMTIAL
jgi:hypothetical protein